MRRWANACTRSAFVALLTATIAMSGCGGGDGSAPPASDTYNLQEGYANFVTGGQTTGVALSGTALVGSNSVSFTGTGTLTYAPAVSSSFNNAQSLSQNESITGSVSAAGQSSPYSSMVTDYYATGTTAFLGESSSNEYDVAQSPITFPDSVVGGSNGLLGNVSRYTDSTMAVSLGSTQLSYTVLAPVDSGGPVSVQITSKIYDTGSNLVETDVTTYTLSTGNELTFVSATAQTTSGNVSVTAQ